MLKMFKMFQIFKYLYKPEYITDIIRTFYCKIADADPTIIKLVYSDDDKNIIVSESYNWTYLHVLIWNGSWDGKDQDEYECFKYLATKDNILIKDSDGKTPLDLYLDTCSDKINTSIKELLKPET